MTVPISARISDDLSQAIDALVAAGEYPSRSRAVAGLLQRALDADRLTAETVRRIIREELARAQLQPSAPAPTTPANPKRAAMLQKVVR